MKKIIPSFFVAVLCLGTIGFCQQNAAEPELDFDAANKAFNQLLGEFGTNLKAPDALAKSATSGGKFAVVAPLNVPYAGGGGEATFTGTDTTAVRVWFELENGRYVDPRFYRWAPGEVFYVHVQAAVPVYVALYQNIPNRPSRQVYPDSQFPHSFQIMAPGVNTRLPVAFQMDRNFTPEYMSVVVSRADWSGIQSHVPQAATTAINAYGTAYAQATATAVGPGGETATAVATVTDGIWKGTTVQEILKGAELRSDEAFAKFSLVNTAGLNNVDYQYDANTKYRVHCRVAYPRYVRPTYYVRYYNNRPSNYVNITNYNITNFNYDSPHAMRGCYPDYSDVSFYLFADHGVGQMQITLNKISRNWRWHY